MQIGSIQASTSQDSFVMLVETWKNHLSKLVLLFTLQRGRCRPTMSPVVASLNNITNKGWVTIANNNGLSGHPWWTNIVRAISYVTPSLRITQDTASCPNKIMRRDIRGPKQGFCLLMTILRKQLLGQIWLVINFGLTSAPWTINHLGNDIFREFIDEFVILYIDDVHL